MRGYRRDTSADWIMYLCGGICLLLSLLLVVVPYFSEPPPEARAPVPTASSMVNRIAQNVMKSDSGSSPPGSSALSAFGALGGGAQGEATSRMAELLAAQQSAALGQMQQVMKELQGPNGAPVPDPAPIHPSEVRAECDRVLNEAMKNRTEVMAQLGSQLGAKTPSSPSIQDRLLAAMQHQLGGEYCRAAGEACATAPEGLECKNVMFGLSYARSMTSLGESVKSQFEKVAQELGDAEGAHRPSAPIQGFGQNPVSRQFKQVAAELGAPQRE